MPVMKRLTVGGTTYDTVGEASVTQVQTSGTKIATIAIDGTSTDLYAPEGGGGGSTVTVTQSLSSGTQVASISVDGNATNLYAPTPPTASSTAPSMDGTASAGSSADYARGDHVHPSDTSKLGGVILNTSSEPYSVPVSSGNATITIGDGLNVSDSNDRITLKARTGTTSDTVAAGNHTHSGYQATLVSGTNIKTVNSTSLLGSGDVAVQPTLVSGTNIKTVGSQSLLGSGNLTVSNIGAAASTHAHGDITSGGDITATAPTIASGDKLIINDESASKVTNGPSFGTSTTTFLANNGTWQTPAGGVSMSTATATIPTSGWSSDSITVNVTGVTASNNVIVAPAPADTSAWASAGIVCTAQGSGTLTFTRTSANSAALTANVLILS